MSTELNAEFGTSTQIFMFMYSTSVVSHEVYDEAESLPHQPHFSQGIHSFYCPIYISHYLYSAPRTTSSSSLFKLQDILTSIIKYG